MREQYAEGIKIIKRKPKSKVLGILVITILCVFAVSLFAQLFSKTLNVGNFSIVSLILGGNDDKIKEHSYFAVMLGKYNDKSEALNVAMGSSVAGASGYIWESDGYFYPVGSIYKTKEEADKVLEQLKNSVYKVNILEIKFKEIVVDESSREKEVVSVIYDSLNYLNELFENFLTHSIQLEKNEITYVASASFINAYASEIKVYESKMQYLIDEYSDEMLKKIKDSFVLIEASLNNTVSTLLSNFSPVSDIKYGLVDFVFRYNSLNLSL